jgi:hypothetical protein
LKPFDHAAEPGLVPDGVDHERLLVLEDPPRGRFLAWNSGGRSNAWFVTITIDAPVRLVGRFVVLRDAVKWHNLLQFGGHQMEKLG